MDGNRILRGFKSNVLTLHMHLMTFYLQGNFVLFV